MKKTELYKLIRCGNYNEAAFLLLEHASPYGMKVSSPSEAFPILRKYGAKRQEHFIALLLNGAHEVIKEEIISIGIANRTVVHPREVYYPAILYNAVAILVAHNHPSGRVDPSAEDREIQRNYTRRHVCSASRYSTTSSFHETHIFPLQNMVFLNHSKKIKLDFEVENPMAGLNRNAASNLRLRQSGQLTEELKMYKIRKVECGEYTLEKDGKIVVIRVNR